MTNEIANSGLPKYNKSIAHTSKIIAHRPPVMYCTLDLDAICLTFSRQELLEEEESSIVTYT